MLNLIPLFYTLFVIAFSWMELQQHYLLEIQSSATYHTALYG